MRLIWIQIFYANVGQVLLKCRCLIAEMTTRWNAPENVVAPRQEFVVVVVELPLSGLVGLTMYQGQEPRD